MTHEALAQQEKLNPRMVAQLVQENFPELHQESIEYVGEGADNAVFRVNNQYMFRFSKSAEISDINEKEARLLPLMQKKLSLSVPNVEFLAMQPNGHYFLGYKEIKGIPLSLEVYSSLDEETKERALKDLARFLTELRSFPIEEARNVGVIERKLDVFVGKVWTNYSAASAFLSDDEHRKVENLFRWYLNDVSNFTYVPALVHADIGPAHMLFDADKKCVAGIIDWSDMVITDPALEMQDIYQNYGREFTERLLVNMGTDCEMELKKASLFTIVRNLDRYLRRAPVADTRATKNLNLVKKELSRM